MKPTFPPRSPAPLPALAWAAPAMAPLGSGTTTGAHAVLQRSFAPRQLTLQLRPRG